MKKLRLLLFETCNRSCSGCCNKDYDLKNLPIEDDFSDYENIMLTGGEPLLKPSIVIGTIRRIRNTSDANIFVYTAMSENHAVFAHILKLVEGITLTIHEQSDVEDFESLCCFLTENDVYLKSLRLNVFKDIKIDNIPDYWTVKDNIEWIVNCPLPKDEVFRRLN